MHSCFLFKLDALRTWPRPGCWWCLRSGHCEDLTQKNANGCSALKHLTWTSYRILFKRSTDTRHFEQCWGMPHTVRGPEQRGTHHSTYYMKTTKPLRKIFFHTLKQRNQTKFRHWLELRKVSLEISFNVCFVKELASSCMRRTGKFLESSCHTAAHTTLHICVSLYICIKMCEMLYDKCVKKNLGFNKEVQQWDLTNSRNLATWPIFSFFLAPSLFKMMKLSKRINSTQKKTNKAIRVQ